MRPAAPPAPRRTPAQCGLLIRCALLAGILAGSLHGAEASTPSAAEFQQHLNTFAAFGDRSTGTPGNVQAADFIRGALARMNIGAVESHAFAVPIVRRGVSTLETLPGGATLTLHPLAGNAVTEAVQSAYNSTFEVAEAMKIDGPDADEAAREAFRKSVLGFADPICTEIERSIDYFRSTSGGDHIKKILISGGVAAIPGITADLTQRLGIETEILNPFRKIDCNKKVLTPERIDEIRPIAAVAVGLALRKVGDK